MNFCELSEKEYRLFLDHHPLKSFVGLPEMGIFKKEQGFDVYYVGIKEKETIKCATILFAGGNFLGKKSFYSPIGFLIDYEDQELLSFFTKELKKFIKKKNGYVLTIDPYYPLIERDIDGNIVEGGFNHKSTITTLKKCGYFYTGNTSQNKYLFILNVENKDEDTLLKNMNSNAKRSIKKSLKPGIIFRDIKEDELELFKTLTSSSSEKHGFSDRSLEYYQKIYQLFVPKKLARFVICEIHFKEYIKEMEQELKNLRDKLQKAKETIIHDIKIQIEQTEKKLQEAKELQKEKGDIFAISCGVFITYGEEVIYLFGGNLKEYSHFHTAYRVQWEMIKFAKEHHYKIYNFYGILGTKKDGPGYGVYSFKRGFDGNVVELIGEFELPITNLYHSKKIVKKIIKR